MHIFKNLSINTKLNLSVLLAVGPAVLFIMAALSYNDINLIRSSKVQQLSALANVLGANSTAALTFDDPTAAKELLSCLSRQPTIRLACIYTGKGHVFATYKSDKGSDLSPPSTPPTDPVLVDRDFLDITQEIVRDGEQLGSVYFHASTSDVNEQLIHNIAIIAIVGIIAMVAAFILLSRLQRTVSQPILELARSAEAISLTRNYSTRVEKFANNELGTLYDEFNAMLDQIQHSERELQQAHDELEIRVHERTRELSHANLQLSNEINERKRAETELDAAHQQLLEVARKTGMAEVATGVLHNIGNVLNSVNVSATLVADRVRNSRLHDFTRTLDLINQHSADLGDFLSRDEKGQRVPGFLQLVAAQMSRDQTVIFNEMNSLTKNIDHIKSIIAMQQSYAGVSGLVETVSLAEVLDDALKLNISSLNRCHIEVIRDYADIANVRIEKQKLLQILLNLVANAKDALMESDSEDRRLIVHIRVDATLDAPKVFIEVEDTGIGIAKENLTRVFSHGFTTKRHGHGFGLHSSANAAKELGGTLTAQSDGPGLGSRFTLQLPFMPVEVLT